MEWNEIQNSEDMERFLSIFNYFHDSCLKGLCMWTDSYVNEDFSMNVSMEFETNIRILFQRQESTPSAIELLFEGVTQFHLNPPSENHDSIINNATLVLQDGLFYWADDDWEPNAPYSVECNWISSKKAKWRDVSSWMGKQRRYGVLKEH